MAFGVRIKLWVHVEIFARARNAILVAASIIWKKFEMKVKEFQSIMHLDRAINAAIFLATQCIITVF